MINKAHIKIGDVVYGSSDSVDIMYDENTNVYDKITELSDKHDNIQIQVNECFQSVSDGKALIASAITDKKVPTDATATFETMANNISNLKLGSGNATKADVLAGKTFTNSDGVEYTGEMPNIKAIDDAISSTYVTNGSNGTGIYARMNQGAHVTLASSGYPEVYVPNSQLTTALGLTADKIVKGNTILGIAGSATAAGKLTNWQIGGSKTGSGANDIYTVGNKLFTLGQASNGYLSLTLKTLKPCYITITKYVQTYSNEGAEATPTVIKKNEYVSAGYTWNSPYEQNVIHIFAYTV